MARRLEWKEKTVACCAVLDCHGVSVATARYALPASFPGACLLCRPFENDINVILKELQRLKNLASGGRGNERFDALDPSTRRGLVQDDTDL